MALDLKTKGYDCEPVCEPYCTIEQKQWQGEQLFSHHFFIFVLNKYKKNLFHSFYSFVMSLYFLQTIVSISQATEFRCGGNS